MFRFYFVRIPTGLWSMQCLELFKLYGMMKIASDVFLVAQRPAEDQPNEQEEGCWQPGTGPIQTGTVYPTSRSTSECMTADGTHPPPFVRSPATRHLNIIFHTFPQALCSVSTQLSVWPRAKCRTVVHYEILLLAPPLRPGQRSTSYTMQRSAVLVRVTR